jgi:hypothetical protein
LRVHLIRQHRDLLVSQASAGVLREGRHRGSRHTVRDGIPELIFADHRQENGIIQRAGGAKAAVATMTTGAIASVKRSEIGNLIREDKLFYLVAAAKQQDCRRDQ